MDDRLANDSYFRLLTSNDTDEVRTMSELLDAVDLSKHIESKSEYKKS